MLVKIILFQLTLFLVKVMLPRFDIKTSKLAIINILLSYWLFDEDTTYLTND